MRIFPKYVKQIVDLLLPEERRHAAVLLGMIFLMALLDVVGIASIMPFMAVLSDPRLVESNAYLNPLYRYFEFSATSNFLVFLGLAVFFFLFVSILFKALTTWAILRFTFKCEYSLARRVLSRYLQQPYEWFLNRHSASLGKTVLSEVEQVVTGYFLPLMQCAAQCLVLIVLLALIILVDPILALSIFSILGIAYLFLFLLIKKRLAVLGVERLSANERRFEAVVEIFGGIKEIKVSSAEAVFMKRYDSPAERYAGHQALAKTMFLLPRYALEAIAFGGILLVAIYLVGRPEGLQGALPLLALYAMAGYRMMPALQQVFAYASQLKFTYPLLANFHKDYTALSLLDEEASESVEISFYDRIIFTKVSYAYPGAHRSSLTSLTIEIPVRSTIGLVGTTGSGKTTAVDILLGLLYPQSGEVQVDGLPITKANRFAWRKMIGYVPQNIFLSDDTIAANIAFGIATENIDMGAVIAAARLANIDEFIQADLPAGYTTRIGERGIRLSGGQRQRIAIARALYHQPQVLVLDEATSALDNRTELAVMDAVRALSKKMTIVLIAHRLSTVRTCDKIYLLERGALVGEGTYEELMSSNNKFEWLATGISDHPMS